METKNSQNDEIDLSKLSNEELMAQHEIHFDLMENIILEQEMKILSFLLEAERELALRENK